MEYIKPTCNRKTRAYKTQQNTFGLLPGKDMWKGEVMGTCPGATSGPHGCWSIQEGRKCATCYVAGVMSAYPGVYPVLKHNTQVTRDQSSYSYRYRALESEFNRFESQEVDRKVAGKPYAFNYRLHWAGDVFNEEYAQALVEAMATRHHTHFWCYTRSLFAVPILLKAKNLNLYISLDPQNMTDGLSTYVDNKTPDNNLRLCYMSKVHDFHEHLAAYRPTFDARNAIRRMIGAPEKDASLLDIHMPACPADSGKMKSIEGVCHKCRMCLGKAEKHIWFES